MVLKKQQVDITEDVVGKIQNGEINLYSGERKIGKVTKSNEGITYSLEEGFETNNGHIFEMADVTVAPDKKYTDCDQGGWC
ncbi:YusG family protein [Peribacillus deserti]|nr:YusG family protein [Peribacillus deserti]